MYKAWAKPLVFKHLFKCTVKSQRKTYQMKTLATCGIVFTFLFRFFATS